MAISVTKTFDDALRTQYVKGFKVDMNSASSGNFSTGLKKILSIRVANASSATAVRAMPNSNNGTADSASGYVYIADATTSDILYVEVTGI